MTCVSMPSPGTARPACALPQGLAAEGAPARASTCSRSAPACPPASAAGAFFQGAGSLQQDEPSHSRAARKGSGLLISWQPCPGELQGGRAGGQPSSPAQQALQLAQQGGTCHCWRHARKAAAGFPPRRAWRWLRARWAAARSSACPPIRQRSRLRRCGSWGRR